MTDLAGRTFLVTGGNTGIGLATARGLVARGGRVHLACRSADRGQAAVAAITAATGSTWIWPTWLRSGPARRLSSPSASRCMS